MSRKSEQATGPTISLDIDGVLIVPALHATDRWILPSFRAVSWSFLPGAVVQLRRVLKEIPDSRLVISSTWRIGHIGGDRNIVEHLFSNNDTLDLLARFHGPTIDWCSPSLPSGEGSRYQEIRAWLHRHSPVAFCAIDDDPEIGRLPEAVQIDPEHDMAEANADRAIALLRRYGGSGT